MATETASQTLTPVPRVTDPLPPGQGEGLREAARNLPCGGVEVAYGRGGDAVGFLRVRIVDGDAVCDALFAKKGHDDLLLRALRRVRSECRARGIETLYLSLTLDQAKVKALYERLGMEHVGWIMKMEVR